jgi:hypothetical protein
MGLLIVILNLVRLRVRIEIRKLRSDQQCEHAFFITQRTCSGGRGARPPNQTDNRIAPGCRQRRPVPACAASRPLVVARQGELAAGDGQRRPPCRWRWVARWTYRWRQVPRACVSPAMQGGTDAVASQPDHSQGASPASHVMWRLSASGLTSDRTVAGALLSDARTGQRHDYGWCRDRWPWWARECCRQWRAGSS